MTLNPFGTVSPAQIVQAAERFGTPFFLYDEALIKKRCQALLGMPNAFGLEVRFAMKANPSLALLQVIAEQGLGVDASSMNEARRAHIAGIPYGRLMLTTQDVPSGEDRAALEQMLREGMTYNICSQRQLELVLPFLMQNAVRSRFASTPESAPVSR